MARLPAGVAAIGSWPRTIRITAESSTSGYQSFANSKAQPPGSGAAAKRLPRALTEEPDRAVEREEEVPRGDQLGRAREGQIGARRRPRPELAQLGAGRRRD